MSTGYTRTDTSDNISNGNVIDAADLDNEFNAIQAAFDATTGHEHDGTVGGGSPITTVGPNQEIVITATDVRPKNDNTLDLGTSALEFKNLYLDGTANVDLLQVDENATITGNLTVNGNTTLGNATGDTVTLTARVASDIVPSTDNAVDIGSSTLEFKDLYLDGTANVDTLQVDENATVTGNLTVTGNISANGNTTLGNATTDTITFTGRLDASVIPLNNDDIDLGSLSNQFQDLYLDGTATVDTLQVDENATVTGNLTVNGNTAVGNADTDTVTFTAGVNSNFLPLTDDAVDLGSSTKEWRNLWIDGTANVDSLVADTVSIAAGNATLAGIDVIDTTGGNITLQRNDTAITSGEVLGTLQFQAPNVAGGGNATVVTAAIRAVSEDTFDSTVNKTSLQFRTANNGAVATKVVLESDGDVLPAADNTQSLGASGTRWKEVFATTLTATDLAATTLDATNLEVTNIKAKDGTSAGSVANTTGAITLNNATLTTATLGGNPKLSAASPNLLDTNNNELLGFSFSGSAVNNLEISNANTGLNPAISGAGSDANVGINLTPKGEEKVNVIVNSANTSSVLEVLRLQGRTTGTPATGIGTSVGFVTETGVSVFSLGSVIESVSTDVTASSEDFDLVFRTMAGGATASEASRMTATGDLKVVGGVIARTGFTDTGVNSTALNNLLVGYRAGVATETGNTVSIRAAGDAAGNATQMTFETNSVERLRLGPTGEYGIAGANYGIQGDVITSGGSGAAPAWSGAEYTVTLNANFTLTSTTSAQALFPAATDTLTLPVGTYEYEMFLSMDTMSATSGNGAFNILGAGTATISNALSYAVGIDAAAGAGAAQGGSYWTGTTSNAAIVTAAVETALGVYIRGVFRVSVAGTIIPSFALQTANAAVVKRDTNFRVKRLYASATGTSYGPWA